MQSRGRGRPKGKGRKTRPHPVSFRFSQQTSAALDRLTNRWGWSRVVAVERAIAFADSRHDFTPTTTAKQEAA